MLSSAKLLLPTAISRANEITFKDVSYFMDV